MVSLLLTTALAALLAIPSAYGESGNKQWNKDLQETCGTNMREIGNPYSRKVLNGTAAHFNESPWSVGVYIPDYRNHTIYTTGTLISDRHIVTYDWIFITNDTKGIRFRFDLSPISWCGTEDRDMILPPRLVRQIGVFADLLRADRFSGRKQLDVKRVRILNGCVQPRTAHSRIAVITLKKPITKDVAMSRPVCLGLADSNPPKMPWYRFYGFGDNRGDVMDATLRHTQLITVPCDYPSAETFCVQSPQPLCNGDFGGAAVKKVHGTIHAFGMYVDGPYECAKATPATKFTFVNLTYVAESVCEQTGVCPTYLADIPDTTHTDRPGLTTDAPMTTGPGGETTGPTGGSTGEPESTGPPQTTGPTGTGETPTTDDDTQTNMTCYVDDDDDIHIHIKLSKFRKTGNEEDIEVIRSGPNRKPEKRLHKQS